MENIPLVSCTVVTYNSSKYVLETLESIYYQTYPRLELIVSDDCSTDNTVQLCKEWIERHKERFERTLVLEIDHNTGVSANLNRADAACQGEWCKGIAGDDLLLPNCVQDCMDYVTSHPDDDIVYLFGRVEAFGGTSEHNAKFNNDVFDYSIFDLTCEQQYEKLMVRNCIPAATCFTNRKGVLRLGIKNDERIPMLEDWPKWLRLTKAGVKLNFLDKTIVKYRLHQESLSTGEISHSSRVCRAKVWIYYLYKPFFKRYPWHSMGVYLRFRYFVSESSLWRCLWVLYRLADKLLYFRRQRPTLPCDKLLWILH